MGILEIDVKFCFKKTLPFCAYLFLGGVVILATYWDQSPSI